MRVFYADHHHVELPDAHRFPMHKYRLLREALLSQRILSPAQLGASSPISEDALLLTHCPGYVRQVLAGELDAKQQRRIGLPWSPSLLDRARAALQGTLDACRAALVHGASGNLAGGTHHAQFAHGEGFCFFNDIAVALNVLLHEGAIERAVVLDLDVHQGNGTAALFAREQRVMTISLHGEKNYPYRKIAGDLDIGLPDGASDSVFLSSVRECLDAAFAHAPDLIVYQAGVDALEHDRLGRLAVSFAGMEERDRLVLGACERWGIPVALTMGGGYSPQIEHTIRAHVQTYQVATELFG